MNGRVCLITGASSGIGKATATELAKMGATLVMVCRDRSRGELALGEVREASGNDSVRLMLSDLSSLGSVRELAEAFLAQQQPLHVLVNNAGIFSLRHRTTVDGFEETFAVNYLAPFLLTNLLLNSLRSSAPSRIVNVSSASHYGGHIDFDDLQGNRRYRGGRAYSQSKLALVLFTHKLAEMLAGTGVTANSLHPGVVATNIWRRSAGRASFVMKIPALFMASPKEGAETVVFLASSSNVERVSGEYFEKKAAKRSSKESYDRAVADRLWNISGELTGLAATRSTG